MFRLVAVLPLAVACGASSGLTPFPGAEAGAGAAGGPEAEAWTYRLVDLAVDADVTDNHLPEALDALEAILPAQDWSLDEFNATLADNVTNWSTIYVEIHPGSPLNLHVKSGLGEVLTSTLEGELVGESGFAAGPGDVSLDFVVSDGVAPVTLALLDTEAEGAWGEALDGTFQTVLPLDVVIEGIVAPAIPPEGFDLAGDGVNETPEEILAFVWTLAPAIADVTLPDGTPAITARLNFVGALEPAE